MNTQNLRIGTKLSLAFTVMALMTVLLGALAWQQMRTMNAAAEDITSNWLPSVQSLDNMRIAANRIRRTESQIFLPSDAAVGNKFRAALRERIDGMAAAEAVYAPMATPGEEIRLFETYKKERDAYFAIQQRMLALPDSGRDAAFADFMGVSEQAFDLMAQTLGTLSDFNRKGSDKAGVAVRSAYTQAQFTLLGLVLASAVIAIGLAMWITKLITRPIIQAVHIAQGVAGGNLTMEIEVAGRDESAQLMQALAEMRTSLSTVVGDVRGNAEGVAIASAEIEQGNQDLSSRTEQQASALQQTAASMEELSSTVRNNADNAQKASELAANASSVAQQSGEDVGSMVATMRTIDQASKSIGEITSVIDSIAFQTNILALNAAVEAARAGDQGRGFAVVATEVRNLAKRSADAAKEIKSLIDTSTARVQEGAVQADRAGTSMRQVQDSIQRVAAIVSEISVATREQSEGISQVGEAVTQMDQTTQQNAALVEESAAAASSLKQQAQQLVASVAVFRLSPSAVTVPVIPATQTLATRSAVISAPPRRPLPMSAASPRKAMSLRTPLAKPAKAIATTADDDWSSF